MVIKRSRTHKEDNRDLCIEKLSREISVLKKTNMFLSSLYDGISEEIIVIDQDFYIIDANRAFLAKAGLEKKEVSGRRCYDIKRAWRPCLAGAGDCPGRKGSNRGTG